jgi:hypothetical protein
MPWLGEVMVYDPRVGEIRGHRQLRQFVRRSQSLLSARHARTETLASTAAGPVPGSHARDWPGSSTGATGRRGRDR